MSRDFGRVNYDLIVVSIEPFPFGEAATNRMLSYLTGIAQSRRVMYLCVAGPVGGNNPNTEPSGTFYGIDFRYMGHPVDGAGASRLVRAWRLAFRHILLVWLLLFKYSCKSVLMYSSSPRLGSLVRSLCRVRGWRSYKDITELRMVPGDDRFSGIIAISSGIYDYYSSVEASRKFLLPVLVDMKRFSGDNSFVQPSGDAEPYVFCCSGANLERDGLLDCLNGFLLFHSTNAGSCYKFLIASALDMSNPYHVECKKIMDAHSDAIEYLGALPTYEIPRLLCRATALLLTPHKPYLTKGFPTKLGEYLASGTPTVCSSIDDLTSVLPAGPVGSAARNDLGSICCYWVEPNSPVSIADRLTEIISDPVGAALVGDRGRSFMEKNFTIDSYKESLMDFLNI